MTGTSRPPAHLLALLDAERSRGFEGLAGSRVDAKVPLRQAALDAALARVRGWPTAVDAIAVEIGAANRLTLAATVRVLGFRTPVRLQLRLASSMEDGLVRLDIDDGSLMGSAVALLGPLLGNLPEGVVLEGRQLTVDVRRLAARQGLDDLAGLLSSATFDSNPGVVWMTIQATAPVSAPTRSPGTPRVSPADAAIPFDAASVRAWLQGSRVDVDLRMDERLANDVLHALHADAQLPTGDERRDTVTGALRPPAVRFEAGAVRVSATAALDHDDR